VALRCGELLVGSLGGMQGASACGRRRMCGGAVSGRCEQGGWRAHLFERGEQGVSWAGSYSEVAWRPGARRARGLAACGGLAEAYGGRCQAN
jgi:hypothetical protein